MAETLLQIRDLHVAVGDKEIIRGIDLDIDRGSVHALMGPNGSGKSTLSLALMGHPKYVITKGDIRFQGRSIIDMAPHERSLLGMFLCFQYPSAVPGVSVANFLRNTLMARHKGQAPLKPAEFKRLLDDGIRKLHMEPNVLGRYVNDGFSGGEKKRLEMLQALVLQPALAILDETDSGLDIDALRIIAEGIEAQRGPERAHRFHPRFHREAEIAERLVEDDAVVARRRRGEWQYHQFCRSAAHHPGPDSAAPRAGYRLPFIYCHLRRRAGYDGFPGAEALDKPGTALERGCPPGFRLARGRVHASLTREAGQGTPRSCRARLIHLTINAVANTPGRLLTFLAGVTMIAAVGIMCLIPLYSAVTVNGGLHSLLTTTPATSQVMLDTSTQALSTRVVNGVNQNVDALVWKDAGAYLAHSTSFTIQESDFQLARQPSSASQITSLSLVSASMDHAASHLALLQGRLPGNTGADIETLLTPETASNMHATIGSKLVVSLSTFAPRPPDPPIRRTLLYHLLVVGLMQVVPGDPYWHGNTFQPATPGPQAYSDTLLVPNAPFLAVLDQAASSLQSDGLFTSQPFEITWDYPLNVAPLTSDQLQPLIGSLSHLQNDVAHASQNAQNNIPLDGITPFPHLTQLSVYNSTTDAFSGTNSFDLPNTLSRYSSRISVISIPIFILLALIIGLLIFFVSLLAYLLVDRQADAIAALGSRGATTGQFFRSMVALSIILGLVALVIGPLLALMAAGFLAGQSLEPGGRDALNFITNQPWIALLSVSWYAVATALAAIIALILALGYATGINIVAFRRESARSTRRPLWQRLRLDVAAIVIAFAGYALTLYLNSTGNLLDTRSAVLFASPLALIAPLFLALGCILLLLRVYPFLLRLGALLSARGQGAIAMLAFAHMHRSPRQTVRVTLLLALTVAFAGSTAVHLIGATGAFAALLLLGPRKGKYGPDGKPRPIPGHSMPLFGLGVLILWLGWFGFNPGSTLSVDFGGFGYFAYVALTTNVAAATGAVTGMVIAWLKLGKPDISMMLNGALGALVAITAASGYLAVQNR